MGRGFRETDENIWLRGIYGRWSAGYHHAFEARLLRWSHPHISHAGDCRGNKACKIPPAFSKTCGSLSGHLKRVDLYASFYADVLVFDDAIYIEGRTLLLNLSSSMLLQGSSPRCKLFHQRILTTSALQTPRQCA